MQRLNKKLKIDPKSIKVQGLIKKYHVTLSDISNYWMYKKHNEIIDLFGNKFCEESWKLVTMFMITIYGIYATYCNPRCFNNPRWHFVTYPQSCPREIYYYYLISFGYHFQRAIFQFFERKRYDATAMFIHHWVTMGLIIGSMYFGLMQFGNVVLLLHHNTDMFLSSAVTLNNMSILDYSWYKYAQVSYISFAASWAIGRIGIFCYKIIWPLIFYSYPMYTCTGTFKIFVAGLCCLLGLHFYWMRFILPPLIKTITGDTNVKDVRDINAR